MVRRITNEVVGMNELWGFKHSDLLFYDLNRLWSIYYNCMVETLKSHVKFLIFNEYYGMI